MSKVNPFVLIVILFFTMFFLAHKTSNLKNEIKEEANTLLSLEDEAKRLNVLKKVWDKTNLEAKLRTIFDKEVTDKGRVFEIKTGTISKEKANDLIAKIFGETFELEKFTLTTENGDTFSLVLEIAK